MRAALTLLLCLLLWPLAAFADDDDDDEPLVLTTGPVVLAPGEGLSNLFAAMVLADGDCPVEGGRPLLEEPAPPPGATACLRLVNGGGQAGIWRIDFEESFGAGYRFWLAGPEGARDVLVNGWRGRPDLRAGAGRRMASLPILIGPGEAAELRVRIAAPSDLEDADPVLVPEARFDAAVAGRADGLGALFGASGLLILFFAAFARLLGSVPARRYALYFAAATLAAATAEGYLTWLMPAGAALMPSVLGKALEAAQIALHLSFVAAFVEDALPGHRAARIARRLALAAPILLAVAGAIAAAAGGAEGWLRYHDLGMELDPLFEEPASNLPLALAASVTLAWFAALGYAALSLLRGDARGKTLFGLGVLALVAAMLGTGFADEIAEGLGDDHYGVRYVFLFDALLFAAAIVRQTQALRVQRDSAREAELAALRGAAEARALADRHRARLAATGHDLRQPLQSLRLSLEEARAEAPALGERLEASLSYLDGVLGQAVADGRPQDPEPQQGAEPLPLQLVLDNAARMFAAEAAEKGLTLRAARTGLEVRADPVALIRMATNLTSNAIRYTEAGGVLLGARRRGGTAMLEVWDTGPGLTEEEAGALRRPYARGGSGEGEGLGLASTEALASSQGARLEVRSRKGRGSVFAIAGLPLHAG